MLEYHKVPRVPHEVTVENVLLLQQFLKTRPQGIHTLVRPTVANTKPTSSEHVSTPRPRRKTRTLRYPFGKNTFQNLLVFHLGFIVKMFSFRQTHAVVTSQQFHHDLDGQKHWPGVVNMLQYTHVEGLVTDLPLPLRRAAARWGHCLVKLASPNRPLYSHVCRLNSWNPFLVTLSHWGWVKMALGLPHGLCDNAGPLGTAPSAHIRSEFTAQYHSFVEGTPPSKPGGSSLIEQCSNPTTGLILGL
jgi:hypothetical protein